MSLFANRELYSALRRRVIPYLRTFPSVNIWLPACGSGEDVYATAITLREEGLWERATLYATEQNPELLARARGGIYPLADVLAAAGAYRDAGGRATLDEYFVASGDIALMRPLLRERIMFGQHNLASDASFNEFQLVICPNQIAVGRGWLRERAVQLIHVSLCRFGLLSFESGAGGAVDRRPPSVHRMYYERFSGCEGILRKMG